MPRALPAPALPALGAALTLGFGAAIAMWAFGYVARLPGLHLPGPAVAGVLAGILLATGVLARGLSGGVRVWLVAAGAGLVAGMVNLLVLLSLLVSEEGSPNRLTPHAGVMVAGWLAFSAAAVALGALVPTRAAAPGPPPAGVWLARFARVATGGVLALLTLGGVVTSTESGMAVPDWPTSYGANMFLYPLSRMTGGIYFEHAHRLFGALIGLTTLVLTLWVLIADRRRWAKGVAVGALVFVVIQGVLGGGRVELDARALAFIHGVSGQLFFALVCALAAFVSLRWRTGPPPAPSSDARLLRGLANAFLGAMVLQVALGALVRHFHKDGAPSIHAIITHATFAVVVFVLAIAAGLSASRRHAEQPILRRVGKATMHTAGLQMVLGVAALWAVLTYRASDPAVEVILATAHQVIGAVLLACATLLAAWSARLLAPAGSAAAAAA